MLRLKLPENFLNNYEMIKSCKEQLFYLDAAIERCEVENGELCLYPVQGKFFLHDLAQKIDSLFAEIGKSFRFVTESIIFEHEGFISNKSDPHDALFAQRQLITNAEGIYVYKGNLLALIRNLDMQVKAISSIFSAQEIDVPTMVPLEGLKKSGYLTSFPQHVFCANEFVPDLENISSLIGHIKSNKLTSLKSFLKDPSLILSPTVCYHCFESLRGTLIEENVTYTALSKCHRHEFKTCVGLERLQTFTMREIIFYGDPDYVSEGLKKVIDETIVLIKRLNLKARIISASDPFFAIDASKKRTYQSMMKLKYELQVYLPYADKWISAGSFNNHLETLVKPFEISSEKVGFSSGCVGYGFERFALGVIAQRGFESSWEV